MKPIKIISCLMISLLLVLSFSVIQAETTQSSLDNAYFADQMSADTDIYMSIRTDEAYLTQLDGVFQTILSRVITNFVPEQATAMQNVTLYTLLDTAVANAQLGISFERDIRSWLGNSIALGVNIDENGSQDILLIIDHTNREVTEEYVNLMSRGMLTPTPEGNFSVYQIPSPISNTIIAINDDVVYISTNRDNIPFNGTPSPNLKENGWFQDTVSALPADSYNALFVANTAELLAMSNNNNPMLAELLAQTYTTAIGATIIDSISFTLDVAQLGIPMQLLSYISQSVDSNFMQHIPANATGVIQGTNLNGVLDGVIEQAKLMTGQDLGEQLDQVTAILGVDIFELLLSGDFGVYFTYKPDNFEAIVTSALENPSTILLTDLIEGGIVFEITNSDQAQQFIGQLYALSSLALSNAPNVILSQEDIGGNTALILTISNPSMSPIEVIISANDAVFVIGTRESATDILTGNGRFGTNTLYQDSLGYALSNPTQLWYIDRTSLSAMADMGTLWFMPISSFDPPQVIIDTLLQTHNSMKSVSQLFDHATISTSVNGDVLNIRAVVTLSE